MCYFSHVFKFPQETIDAICHALNDPKFGCIDLIVGTGVSGTIISLPVSMQSGIPCGAIRKNLDFKTCSTDGGSHSASMMETFYSIGYKDDRYVIIDDLMVSGLTVDRIMELMSEMNDKAKCVGIILYQHGGNIGTETTHWKIPITNLKEDIEELHELRTQ